MARRDVSIVLVAALVFADATIVTLALPNLLVDLHTTVYGVAAVLGVYTAALGGGALVLCASMHASWTCVWRRSLSARSRSRASAARSPIGSRSCSSPARCR